MSDKNWQGQKGLSANCQLDGSLVLMLLMSADEHPCDRCNMPRDECKGFERKPNSERPR